MAQEPIVSRRAVLQAAALGMGGLLLDACAPTASSPASSPGTSGAAPSQAPGSAAATPEGSGNPVPLRQRIARLLVVGFRGLRV